MGKLRLAMVVSHLAPSYGLESVALSTSRLLRQKYEVDIICVGGTAEDLKICPDAIVLGKPLRGIARLRSLWRLFKFSREVNADRVLVAGVWVAVPWLLVAGACTRKTLVWEHSLLRARFARAKQLRLLAVAAGFLYSRSAGVVTVSEPLREDVATISRRAEIRVIPNPLQPRLATPRSKSPTVNGKLRIATVGSLTPLKAQHLLIQALGLVKVPFELTVAGSGPELVNLQRLAHELRIADRIHFAGFLEPEGVHSLLMGSDLMVHCAVAETFGMVYVESADAGLPVISTRSAVAEHMIPRYVPGWICEATAEALAAAISQYAFESISSESSREAATRRAESFGESAVLLQWSKILESHI